MQHGLSHRFIQLMRFHCMSLKIVFPVKTLAAHFARKSDSFMRCAEMSFGLLLIRERFVTIREGADHIAIHISAKGHISH